MRTLDMGRVVIPLLIGIAIAAMWFGPIFVISARAQEGVASWYGIPFHGRTTANGERYDMNALTCAHRKLKFGTEVRITNLSNGKTARCRINDRGPFVGGRIIDVSRLVANQLGMLRSGVARVSVLTIE